jgi:hypothetical protein
MVVCVLVLYGRYKTVKEQLDMINNVTFIHEITLEWLHNLSDTTHVWIRIHQEFYDSIVHVANEEHHINQSKTLDMINNVTFDFETIAN